MLAFGVKLAVAVAAPYVVGPLAVRSTFRFSARCNPTEVALDSLPEPIDALFRKRIPELAELDFELAGCYDCGSLASQTRSYIAYFVNRHTRDFANVSVVVSPKNVANYLEFSTSFSNGMVLDTNTNRVLPLTPPNSQNKVFRFPELQNAAELLHAHQQLLEKYAAGLWKQAEPRGQEIRRLVRTVENYGPRHCQIGYMYSSEDGQAYRLTWKGAFLMAWRALWPVSFVRRWVHRHAMNSELHSLESAQVAALQKA